MFGFPGTLFLVPNLKCFPVRFSTHLIIIYSSAEYACKKKKKQNQSNVICETIYLFAAQNFTMQQCCASTTNNKIINKITRKLKKVLHVFLLC